MLTKTVTCPLEGFETVEATYNLLATPTQITQLQRSVGDNDPGKVIVAVTGLPDGLTEPFGMDSPMALQLWLVHGGLQEAIRAFVNDPLSWMGSKRSTTATSKDA